MGLRAGRKGAGAGLDDAVGRPAQAAGAPCDAAAACPPPACPPRTVPLPVLRFPVVYRSYLLVNRSSAYQSLEVLLLEVSHSQS